MMFTPDQEHHEMVEPNPKDRFPTIIAGEIDRIWRSHRVAYYNFIRDHYSLVLATNDRAVNNLGERSWNSPSEDADSALLW